MQTETIHKNIENRQDRGRSFIAQKHYEPGDIILIEESYATITCLNYKDSVCSYCGFFPITTAYTISSTDDSRYCSEFCITKDYYVHMLENEVNNDLANMASVSYCADNIRLMIKMASMFKFNKDQVNALSTSSSELSTIVPPVVNTHNKLSQPPLLGKDNNKKTIFRMEANSTFMLEESLSDLNQIAKTLLVVFLKYDFIITIEEIEYLLLLIQCNAHRINIDTINPLLQQHNLDHSYTYLLPKVTHGIGLGIFPIASMINHSCDPNCVHDFIIQSQSQSLSTRVTQDDVTKSPQIRFRAIKRIAVNEEITYSYVPLYDSTYHRQQKLQNAYGFICQCPRCTVNNSYKINCDQENDFNSTAIQKHELLSSISFFYSSDKPNSQFYVNKLDKETFFINDVMLKIFLQYIYDECLQPLRNNHVGHDNSAIIETTQKNQYEIEALNNLMSAITTCYTSLYELLSQFVSVPVTVHKETEGLSINENEYNRYIDDYDRLLLLVAQIYTVITDVHPCHKTLLMAYSCLSRYSLALYYYANKLFLYHSVTTIDLVSDQDLYVHHSLLFSWLAVGCVTLFTMGEKIVSDYIFLQNEIIDLLEINKLASTVSISKLANGLQKTTIEGSIFHCIKNHLPIGSSSLNIVSSDMINEIKINIINVLNHVETIDMRFDILVRNQHHIIMTILISGYYHTYLYRH